MSIELTLYSKPDCSLCDKALPGVKRVAVEFGLVVRKVDIEKDRDLHALHRYRIPVIELDGVELAWGRVDEAALRQEVARRLTSSNSPEDS